MYRWDFLHMPLVGRFIRSRFYPGIFQYPLLFALLLILLWAFFGTVQASKNIATLVTWGIWWALLPFSFFLFGRIWCGVCPLAKTGDLLQKCFTRSRKYPGPFLRRNGIWIMIFLFVALTWVDRIYSFASSPKATGILLLLLLAGAVIVMFFFRGRTWCRYLCPVGGLSGVYSMASVTELRSQKETCHKVCKEKEYMTRNGEELGCPLFERPPVMESNRNCNFCVNCLSSCGHGALSWRLRGPTRELGQLQHRMPAEAFLALIMVILVYVQTISMSKVFPRYMKWFIEGTFIENYHVAFTLTFLVLLFVGFLLYCFVCYLSSRQTHESPTRNFASFGYALIPLGLAGHLAHNMFHLIKEGKEAVKTILLESGTLLGSVNGPTLSSHGVTAEPLFIRVTQIAIVLLGIFGSMLVLQKSDRLLGGNPHLKWSRIWPHIIFVGVFGIVFIHLFFLPMNPRHFH